MDVTVIDKNDQPPKFTHIFSARVPESAPVGSFVVRVTSTDADVGINAIASYSLTGDTNGRYEISIRIFLRYRGSFHILVLKKCVPEFYIMHEKHENVHLDFLKRY